MTVPDLHPIYDGAAHEATCGRCLARSESVPGPIDEVWPKLVAVGWTLYQHTAASRQYAVCPTCSMTPHSVDIAAARARKARKRK